jgi:hypothetical protein
MTFVRGVPIFDELVQLYLAGQLAAEQNVGDREEHVPPGTVFSGTLDDSCEHTP